MTTATTIATTIAEAYGDDGQNFINSDGDHIEDCCQRQPGAERTDHNGDVRFVFNDGSVIVITGGAWDIGLGPRCFCFEGAGHTCLVEVDDE